MLGKVTLLVAVLLSAGCTPGMFFDILEGMTETAERACRRAGGEFVSERVGENFHYECKK